MIDAALSLEPEREKRRAYMAGREPENWSPDDDAQSRNCLNRSGELNFKLTQGSDYPYRAAPGALSIDYGQLGIRSSFAQGGLSNVWGAAAMPFREADLSGWPIEACDLKAAYAEVAGLLNIGGKIDDLTELFSLPINDSSAPPKCNQIKRFAAHLQKNKGRLQKDGIYFGSSRIAGDFAGGERSHCNLCGRCLHGCPRDLIYSSRHTLQNLMQHENFRYVPGITITSISEQSERIIAQGSYSDGNSAAITGERLFLGAGVLNSTAILLNSLGRFDHELSILDSQYYLFPLIQLQAAPRVHEERLFTLAQIFVEIFDPKISPYSIHLQCYGYNDLLRDMISAKLGVLARVAPLNAFLGRLLLIQGYLHSDHSGSIRATLKRTAAGIRLDLAARPNPEARRCVLQIVNKLRKHSASLRASPLIPLLRITEPGRGFHIGGSFPMVAEPRSGQTDVLGRPHQWSRLHIVDAASFPSIAASTITQTVMANAYRIGRRAAALE